MHLVLEGFFKSLRQEFALKETPVDITIMPLPYVLTDKVLNILHCMHDDCYIAMVLISHVTIIIQAVDNWKPIGEGGGITSEVKTACMHAWSTTINN